MSTAQFRLKRPAGWFAAGREMATALRQLSDTTFKLFVWMCLHAGRSHGTVCVAVAEMARALSKSESEITAALEELYQKGVCRPVGADRIEITDRFWPYYRSPVPARDPQDPLVEYVGKVRELYLERSCVRPLFNAADEQLATELCRRGVQIETVQRAILLGSLRKYASWLNHGTGTPITTLHYFTTLFDEVDRLQISADYWRYVAQKTNTLEQRWCRVCRPLDARKETK